MYLIGVILYFGLSQTDASIEPSKLATPSPTLSKVNSAGTALKYEILRSSAASQMILR